MRCVSQSLFYLHAMASWHLCFPSMLSGKELAILLRDLLLTNHINTNKNAYILTETHKHFVWGLRLYVETMRVLRDSVFSEAAHLLGSFNLLKRLKPAGLCAHYFFLFSERNGTCIKRKCTFTTLCKCSHVHKISLLGNHAFQCLACCSCFLKTCDSFYIFTTNLISLIPWFLCLISVQLICCDVQSHAAMCVA